MALVLSASLIGTAAVACCSTGASPASDESTETPSPETHEDAGALAVVARAPAADVELAAWRVAHRSSDGALVTLVGGGEAPAGLAVIAPLGPVAHAAKLGNQRALLDAIARALASSDEPPSVACLLELDLGLAPAGQDTLRTELAGLGYAAQTISGDIATGRASVAGLDRLVATPWVLRLELARPVLPR